MHRGPMGERRGPEKFELSSPIYIFRQTRSKLRPENSNSRLSSFRQNAARRSYTSHFSLRLLLVKRFSMLSTSSFFLRSTLSKLFRLLFPSNDQRIIRCIRTINSSPVEQLLDYLLQSWRKSAQICFTDRSMSVGFIIAGHLVNFKSSRNFSERNVGLLRNCALSDLVCLEFDLLTSRN